MTEVFGMIAFELMFVMILGVVAVVTIAAVGRPLAEAYAERLKAQYKQMESPERAMLTTRIASLEHEVIELKSKLTQLQETTDFAMRFLESSQPALPEIKEQKES